MSFFKALTFVAMLSATTGTLMGKSGGTHKIEETVISGDGIAFFLEGTETPADVGCTNRTRVWLPKTHANYKEIYAGALMAQATGRKVWFWLDGSNCHSKWSVTLPKIREMRVTNKQ